MWMASLSPGYVPKRLAHLPANEQRGMKIDLKPVRQTNKCIELLERLRVVQARAWFEPCPEQVETNRVETQLLHLGEVCGDIGLVPAERPLQTSACGNPMRTDRHKTAACMGKIISSD